MDQRCNLADLIGLDLAMNLLQGQDLRHTRAHEDAMTAPTAYLLEIQRLKQPD